MVAYDFCEEMKLVAEDARLSLSSEIRKVLVSEASFGEDHLAQAIAEATADDNNSSKAPE